MYVVKIPRSKFYQLVYFVEGKRTTVSTKTTKLTEANKFLANFLANPKEQTKEKMKSVSVLSFKEEYVDFITPTKSKKYVRSIELSFKMLVRAVGDIQLTRLDLRTLDKFITHTYARTQHSASLYFRTLKAAFSKAVQWNYITENSFKKIKSPKVVKTFPAFISETELHQILANTNEEYLRDLFYTALYTGMRLGELINMKWSWIDLSQNQIVVQCTDVFSTKSKKERIIPMTQLLRSLFMRRFPKLISSINDDYVFTHIPGIKLNEDFVSKQFKKSVRAAYLDDKIHFHSLRHSYASLLVQRGASLKVIQELLGHEQLKTTEIYSHLQQQNLREAVNLL